MNAHFFDIDTLIRVNNNVWIVSKIKPNIPLIKLTQSEFNLIKSGVYRKYKSSLKIGNFEYWIPENLLNQLKIKCKTHGCDINDITFSMQEFMNPEIISELESDILYQHINHLKNKTDDIYVICSKNTKRNYEPLIEKLQDKLLEIGLQIKNFYHISETFYNRDSDNISHKKIRLLLQHLVGYKTDGDKFTDEEITKYNSVYFYDDEINAINLAIDCNRVFQFILSNTNDNTKSSIKDLIKNEETSLIVNHITHNKIQPFFTKNIVLKWSNIVKTFESFRFRC